MDSLLDRFLRYVRIDTQADETSSSSPSTLKQLTLSRLLAEECRALGLADVTCDEFGIVMATIPSTVDHQVPAIAYVAHVDTSPEYTSTNVNPLVHRNYQGGDVALPGDAEKVIRVAENPDLLKCLSHTLVTSDGTTLLGADDKSGVAVIMTAAAELLKRGKDVKHGPIRLCFTCDEEIGRGTDKLDLTQLGAHVAYTLDGSGQNDIDAETFSADGAKVTVKGINTHPSVGKGAMVNAIRILASFLSRLPTATLAPETTDGREGFIHPYHVEGGVAEASARLILRDFETTRLNDQAKLLESIAETLRAEHPRAQITVEVRSQYRNMREGLVKEPRAVSKAVDAHKALGREPNLSIIRGGTDGSLLTAKGLPTPNLSTGEHNPHSPLEWTSVEEMQAAVAVLVQLAAEWAKQSV
ncbi:peptidase T [Schlesneria paludicola]|uniref:peptidase T n=1 Tax=Schlesneria paludicola TaxID=360056 RepID=UPI000299F488|nr:peptidase T [Schlesneria paludicola]